MVLPELLPAEVAMVLPDLLPAEAATALPDLLPAVTALPAVDRLATVRLGVAMVLPAAALPMVVVSLLRLINRAPLRPAAEVVSKRAKPSLSVGKR